VIGGNTKIKGMWFLGKIPATNRIVGFVLGDQIVGLQSDDGKEYHGMPTVGWKKGIAGGKVISSVVRC
jgi:hypothetical protein